MQAQRLAKKSESSRNRAQILRPRFSTHRERTSSFLLLFLITIADLTGGSERFFNIFPYILHWRFKNSSAFFCYELKRGRWSPKPHKFYHQNIFVFIFFLFWSREISRIVRLS